MKIKAGDANFKEPEQPFRKNLLIKDYNELYAKIYDKEKFINLWWTIRVSW